MLRVVQPPRRQWMTKPMVAEHLGVSVRTIDTWRADRGFPAHKRAGVVRFDLAEVDEWMDKGGSVAA